MPRSATTPQDIYSPMFVKGVFDRMSRSYERMNIVMSFGFSERWRRQLMHLITAPEEADDVMDLMTGMGETWRSLMRTFPNARLQALDFSSVMVEGARERNRRRFGDAFTLHCEDILAGTLPSASFDVIVSAFGLKTFDEDQSRLLADEVARILRPGGQYAFIEVTEPSNPVLRWAYDLYLSRIVPTVGTLLVSDPVEYRMLWRYLRGYGDGAHSERAFRHPDLSMTRRAHFFGCATSFSGCRLD